LHRFFILALVSGYDGDYRILEIEPGASLEQIRQAYNDQTKVWHPDRFADDIRLQKKAEEKLKQINLAYRRLCLREMYQRAMLSRFRDVPPEPAASRIAVFMSSCVSSFEKDIVALDQMLWNRVIAVTKRFAFLMKKTVKLSDECFQWCFRQRKSLALATIAFLLGVAFGSVLLTRQFATSAKISGLFNASSPDKAAPQPSSSVVNELVREGIDLHRRGDTTNALAHFQEAMKRDPNNPTAREEIASIYESLQPFDRWNERWRRLVETGLSAGAAYELIDQGLSGGVLMPQIAEAATSSSKPIVGRRLSGGAFPWKTNVVTTVFWVGEKQAMGKTSPQYESVWDKDWLNNFGGVDDPDPSARHDYIPISFVPLQNPFYCALPYNDVEQGQFKPEAPIVIPWFKQADAQPGQSVCKDRWVAIRKGDRICYAQWEDSGPFRTDHFQYVFQNAQPTPNENHGAGLSVSPAVRDHLGLAETEVVDWRFVEVSDVPPGPWRDYGENNHFVIARRQVAKKFAEQKSSVTSGAIEPAPGVPPLRESVISSSEANAQGLSEQKRSTNSAATKATTQAATFGDESVMPPSAANPEKSFAEQKDPTNLVPIEPAQGATPMDEGVMSPPAAKLDKGLAERKGLANQAATKSAQAHHAPNQRVAPPFAAKAVTTYAPRPPYPQEARSHRISGSGVCVVSVDPATGSVTKVSITQSTGSQLLDKSVLSTVRTWKFKPGTVSKVSIPVEFTNDGDNR
jgi:TonB family protein